MNDSIISALVERLRSVVARPRGYTLDALANVLELDTARFRLLVESRDGSTDIDFAIDVVAALVYEFAIDPEWLLSGTYDSSVHRRALVLRGDRSAIGQRALRDFVHERYSRIKEQAA